MIRHRQYFVSDRAKRVRRDAFSIATKFLDVCLVSKFELITTLIKWSDNMSDFRCFSSGDFCHISKSFSSSANTIFCRETFYFYEERKNKIWKKSLIFLQKCSHADHNTTFSDNVWESLSIHESYDAFAYFQTHWILQHHQRCVGCVKLHDKHLNFKYFGFCLNFHSVFLVKLPEMVLRSWLLFFVQCQRQWQRPISVCVLSFKQMFQFYARRCWILKMKWVFLWVYIEWMSLMAKACRTETSGDRWMKKKNTENWKLRERAKLEQRKKKLKLNIRRTQYPLRTILQSILCLRDISTSACIKFSSLNFFPL